MDDDRFNLVFKGELVPGFDLVTVKKNLSVLFRIDTDKVDVLFSGKEVPLKKGLDATTANKYRVAMKKAGARVNVVPCEVPPTPVQTMVSQAKRAAQAKRHFGAPDIAPQVKSTQKEGANFETALGAQAVKTPEPRKEIAAPDFGLANVGSDLLGDDEKQAVETVDVDLSALSIAPQGGNLVSDEEIVRPAPVSVNDLNVDVLPEGSDLLKPEERTEIEAAQIDTSSITLAAPGERLGEKKKEDPPAPNVDHIRLAD